VGASSRFSLNPQDLYVRAGSGGSGGSGSGSGHSGQGLTLGHGVGASALGGGLGGGIGGGALLEGSQLQILEVAVAMAVELSAADKVRGEARRHASCSGLVIQRCIVHHSAVQTELTHGCTVYVTYSVCNIHSTYTVLVLIHPLPMPSAGGADPERHPCL